VILRSDHVAMLRDYGTLEAITFQS